MKHVKLGVVALVSMTIVLIAIQPLLMLTNSGEIPNTTTYRIITATTYGAPSNVLTSQEGVARVGDLGSPNPSSATWEFILPEFVSEVIGDDRAIGVDAYLFIKDNMPLSDINFFEGSLIDAGRIITEGDSSVCLHNSVYDVRGTHLPVAWYDVTWSHDETSRKYSYDLYLDNDKEEINATVLYDEEESFWSAFQSGSGSQGVTLSRETTEVIKGSSSQKVEIGPGSYADLGVCHQYTLQQNWSSYDFLCLWVYGVNSGETLYVSIKDADGDFIGWTMTENWNGWKRLVLPLNAPEEESGTFDITAVRRLEVQLRHVGSNFTWYLDRTCLDIGLWVKVEAYVPDSITDYKIYSWDIGTSNWVTPQFAWWGTTNDIDSGRMRFLSGDTTRDIYSNTQNGISIFPPAQSGETESATLGYGSSITYSNYRSHLKRVGLAIKMPPEDGQDASDSGISQCKLKFEVYYEGWDDTVSNLFSGPLVDMPITKISMNGHAILNTTLKERSGDYLVLSQEECDMNAMIGSVGPLLSVQIKSDYLGIENVLNITVDHHTSWNISYVMLRLIDSTRQLHIPFAQTLGIYSFLTFILAYSPLAAVIIAKIVSLITRTGHDVLPKSTPRSSKKRLARSK